MTVEIWSEGMLEPRSIEGELDEVATALNLAAAGNRQFVILDKTNGKRCAIERANITVIDEVDDDAFIGR